jgi:NitT/TauT family transport system substrate-binding protein
MKRILGMAALAAVLFAVLACKKKEAASEDDYVFKLGLEPNALCYAPLYVAYEKDYFGEEGLKWEAINIGSGETMNLLTNGSVDGTLTLTVGLIQPLVNGLPVQVPMTLHTGCIKVLVRGDSDIKTAIGLKGKKIGGTTPTSPTVRFTKRYLAGKGFKVDGENADIEFIYQSGAELPLLLERGIVDAIAVVDPAAQIVQDANGFRAVIDNAVDEEYKDEFCCVVSVRTETINAHPVATAKYLRAVQKAAKFVQENPEETVKILTDAKRITGDPLVNTRILKTYSYRASVSQVLPTIERNARDLQAIGILKPDVDVDKLVKDVCVQVPGVPDSLF